MLPSSMSRTLFDAMKSKSFRPFTLFNSFNLLNIPNFRLVCVVSLLSIWGPAAQARVKLVALPERARVVVSLNNPDATLVEEERLITLQKGVNKVDFSWRGVNIDATSIQVRMLAPADTVTVLNTSYPPNENALNWEISNPAAQEERVRISYLFSRLCREIMYKTVTGPIRKSQR